MIKFTGLLLLLSLIFSLNNNEAAAFELTDYSDAVNIYRGDKYG